MEPRPKLMTQLRLGDDYYFRVTRIKVTDYARPKRYQLWKKKKPGRR